MTTNNNYDDLSFCLNILHDFIYNKNTQTCYKFHPISNRATTIDDLKKQNNFIDSREDILNDLQFIGYSKLNKKENDITNKVHFKKNLNSSHSSTISIAPYDTENTLKQDNLTRKEITHMNVARIFSEITATEGINYFLLPIMNFDVTFGKLKELTKKDKSVVETLTSHNKNIKFDNDTLLYVCISEHYYKLYTLEKFIYNNIDKMTVAHWKSLFFQVFYALHKMTEKLRKYRHNKLDLQSIWVYKKKDDHSKIEHFKIHDTAFSVPMFNFDIKITNYEESTSCDLPYNKSQDIIDNPYYDVHYFLCKILELDVTIPDAVINFINNVIPYDLRQHDKTKPFYGMDESYFSSKLMTVQTPVIIMKKNNFFTEFIKENMDLSNSPLSNASYSLEKYNNIELSVSEDEEFSGNKNNIDESLTETNESQSKSINRLMGKAKASKNKKSSKSKTSNKHNKKSSSEKELSLMSFFDDNESSENNKSVSSASAHKKIFGRATQSVSEYSLDDDDSADNKYSATSQTDEQTPQKRPQKKSSRKKSQTKLSENGNENTSSIPDLSSDEDMPHKHTAQNNDDQMQLSHIPEGYFGEVTDNFIHSVKQSARPATQLGMMGQTQGLTNEMLSGMTGDIQQVLQPQNNAESYNKNHPLLTLGGKAEQPQTHLDPTLGASMMPQMGMENSMIPQMGMPQMPPQMDMSQLGMPQMPPQMDMSQMGMPQMGMPQMPPQMDMPQLGMPQMIPQMGGFDNFLNIPVRQPTTNVMPENAIQGGGGEEKKIIKHKKYTLKSKSDKSKSNSKDNFFF